MVRKILMSFKDPRIKVIFLEKNLGISGNTNEALRLATGEFISFMDHDDELAPFALFEVVKAVNEKTDLDIIYSDEDKIDIDGNRSNPFFKPDWSLPMFLSTNYLCHFLVCRKSLADKVGNLRSEFDGSQDYEFALRLIGATSDDKIGHVQKVLYHWRIISSSAASGQQAKPYAYEAGKKALDEYLRLNHMDSEAIIDRQYWGSYRIIKRSLDCKKITIVVVGSIEPSIFLLNILKEASSKSNMDTTVYVPVPMKGMGYKTYNVINEAMVKILEEPAPDYVVFINGKICQSDAGEHYDDKWLCALLEHYNRFKKAGIIGTGSAVYSNVICSVHRTCGPAFCVPSGILSKYIRNNKLNDNYDDLQIALSDYAQLYGYENIYTPYSIGKLNDLGLIPKYYSELYNNRYFTNNMAFYLKSILRP